MRRAEDSLEDGCGACQRNVRVAKASGAQVHLAEVVQGQADLIVVPAQYSFEGRQHPLQRLPRFAVTAARLEQRGQRSTVGSVFEVVSRHGQDGAVAR